MTEEGERMQTMRLFILVTGLAILAFAGATASATTWHQTTVVDPISGAECDVPTPASWGSYIYNWPTKYDGVFWPHAVFGWLWYCPTSGYVSFGDDFADITDAEKAKISEFLTAIKPTLSDEIDLVTRLWLADRIYALRNKDDAWRARYSRIRAVLLEEIANESRRESIALMESGLGQRDVGVETIIDQLVLARYKTCIDYSNDGDQDLTQARKAIEENAAQIGKNAVEYLHALSADIAQQMAQYKRAP